MASGSIVIGSNVSGVKDILKKFPNNLFDANNVQSLKESILMIMNMKKEDHIQLEKEMRALAVNEYSIDQFINMHSEFYKNIIAKK